mgnify:CR=1 FL=1|tara:strand:- start:13271 stop:14737 length:1467 start_codon:yes stop_codon:yes gene_type:complete
MAYIGKINKSTSTLATQTMDSMTGDGTTTTLSLTSTPANVNDVSIYIDGVMQQPGVDYTLDGNTVTFTTAVPLNCYVCACQTQNGDIGTPAADSVTTAKLTDGMFTNSHIPSLSANKLTGALPALDGSALTGVGSGFMENASDPAIDTNPADGLGAVWVNTTSGEIFICTDATTDANVWTNVGAGSTPVPAPEHGYHSGGEGHGGPASIYSAIYKFTYASGTSVSDHGNMHFARATGGAASSSTHGYAAAGQPSSSVEGTSIDRFAFASDAGGADVGDCIARDLCTGGESSTHGYIFMGRFHSIHSTIQKYAFASSVSGSTYNGDAGATRYQVGSCSGPNECYILGGRSAANNGTQDMWKVSHANDTTSSHHGNLVRDKFSNKGVASSTHGYSLGGKGNPPSYPTYNDIDIFSFASNAGASDWGDLTHARSDGAATQNATHGMWVSGYYGPVGYMSDMMMFAFDSSTSSVDVGDLTTPRGNGYAYTAK